MSRPNLPERDPAVDAAWKTHSTELPPPRIDAAILAAAHREARSRPRAIGDDDANARGPSRAWWGLAAAATIGAIAFGVLQLAPQSALEDQPTVAVDTPRSEQAPPAKPQTFEERKSDAAPAPQDKAPTATSALREPTPATRVAPKAPREPRALPSISPPEPVAPPPAAPRPFPDLAQPLAEREVASAADRRSDAAEAPRQRAAAKLAAPARNEVQDNAADAQAPPLPATWIERIRKLHDERRFDEAARELAAFRAVYADADARLPESLRGWAATVKRN